ncbi:RNA/RNP complex-1-interacting phosphatase-like [Daphnia pulicaria]|uniref:RNA/RNP complex-1-interacting phosphatase-like n=1 Tax=Daphnia pulicaria TaxID=35523 RepID=UPI001EEC79E3|nr:RNA/RNP complex-1-interacting phosphatase-like [Daphnia pulicaria]
MNERSENPVKGIQSNPDAEKQGVNTSLKMGVVSTDLESDSSTSASTSCVQHRFSTDSRPTYRGRGPFGNPGPIPNRWENYPSIGEPIEGLPILACRVPLNEHLLHFNNVDLEQWFTPKNLMEKVPTVGCIIDLTATTRYYNPKVFTDSQVQHAKIHCIGHEIPDDITIQRFFSVMDNFLHDPMSRGKVVVVHCTHGLNRTGYLVVRYLVVRRGYQPADAISAFNKARGYPMERENYIENLNQMIQEVCPNPVPLFQERDDKVEVNHQCESTDSTYRPVYNQQSRNYYGGRPWYENNYRGNHYRDRPYADRRDRQDRPISDELPSNDIRNHRPDSRYRHQPARERNSAESRNYRERENGSLNTDNRLQRDDYPRRVSNEDPRNQSPAF